MSDSCDCMVLVSLSVLQLPLLIGSFQMRDVVTETGLLRASHLQYLSSMLCTPKYTYNLDSNTMIGYIYIYSI